MSEKPDAKADQDRKQHGPLAVPFDFEEAIRRAIKATPPGDGTNTDYVKANERYERENH